MGTGCEEAYGFLPCSSSLGGSIFLMLVYGYCLLQGAMQLSDGSELLLEILDPGIIGGLLLPMLGALPDSLIIVVSGLGGTREEAQEQLAVGVGTLAGSTIMLLTIAWGGSLLAARCDLNEEGRAIDRRLTRGWDLLRTGATTDRFTPNNAIIMVATTLLYLSVQIPAFLGDTQDPKAALLGSIVCLLSLAAYCAYQVIHPELQRRKIAAATKKRARMALLQSFARNAHTHGSLLNAAGELNTHVVDNIFTAFDHDNNGRIDEGELRAFLMGVTLHADEKMDPRELDRDLKYLMQEFDKDNDGSVDREEFAQALERWVSEKLHQIRRADGTLEISNSRSVDDLLLIEVPSHEDSLLTIDEEQEEVGDEEDVDVDGEAKEPPTTRQIAVRAILQLISGAAICAFFSDPVVDAVSSFSKASNIPAFFVAFCVTPFASNASELVSSLKFAARKRRRNISLTFSQVYGAVTMNNTMCLGLFLLVVHYRQLEWTYTSEVLVIVGSTILVGVVGASKTTFRAWWALPDLALFPTAIFIVWYFDYVLHLDG